MSRLIASFRDRTYHSHEKSTTHNRLTRASYYAKQPFNLLIRSKKRGHFVLSAHRRCHDSSSDRCIYIQTREQIAKRQETNLPLLNRCALTRFTAKGTTMAYDETDTINGTWLRWYVLLNVEILIIARPPSTNIFSSTIVANYISTL